MHWQSFPRNSVKYFNEDFITDLNSLYFFRFDCCA
jgi:hypothetical protein